MYLIDNLIDQWIDGGMLDPLLRQHMRDITLRKHKHSHNPRPKAEKEMYKKMSRLTVHSVGTANMDVKAGDVVLVDPQALQKAPLIPLSEEESVLLVSPFDVIQIW